MWDCRVLWSVLTFAARNQPLGQSASWERLGAGLPIMWPCQPSAQGRWRDACGVAPVPNAAEVQNQLTCPFPSVDVLW